MSNGEKIASAIRPIHTEPYSAEGEPSILDMNTPRDNLRWALSGLHMVRSGLKNRRALEQTDPEMINLESAWTCVLKALTLIRQSVASQSRRSESNEAFSEALSGICPENMQRCDMGCTGGWCVTLHGSYGAALAVADKIETVSGPCTPAKIAASSMGEKPGTPSMYILNSCDTDEQRIAKLAEALDDLSVAYAAATRSAIEPMNAAALESTIDVVLAWHSDAVAEYRGGNERAFNLLVERVMKATNGQANPAQVNEITRRKLRPTDRTGVSK